MFLLAKPNLEFPTDEIKKGKFNLINGILGTEKTGWKIFFAMLFN
jgi:hypothetical protein